MGHQKPVRNLRKRIFNQGNSLPDIIPDAFENATRSRRKKSAEPEDEPDPSPVAPIEGVDVEFKGLLPFYQSTNTYPIKMKQEHVTVIATFADALLEPMVTKFKMGLRRTQKFADHISRTFYDSVPHLKDSGEVTGAREAVFSLALNNVLDKDIFFLCRCNYGTCTHRRYEVVVMHEGCVVASSVPFELLGRARGDKNPTAKSTKWEARKKIKAELKLKHEEAAATAALLKETRKNSSPNAASCGNSFPSTSSDSDNSLSPHVQDELCDFDDPTAFVEDCSSNSFDTVAQEYVSNVLASQAGPSKRTYKGLLSKRSSERPKMERVYPAAPQDEASRWCAGKNGPLSRTPLLLRRTSLDSPNLFKRVLGEGNGFSPCNSPKLGFSPRNSPKLRFSFSPALSRKCNLGPLSDPCLAYLVNSPVSLSPKMTSECYSPPPLSHRRKVDLPPLSSSTGVARVSSYTRLSSLVQLPLVPQLSETTMEMFS